MQNQQKLSINHTGVLAFMKVKCTATDFTSREIATKATGGQTPPSVARWIVNAFCGNVNVAGQDILPLATC